jgi:hypothetical protein
LKEGLVVGRRKKLVFWVISIIIFVAIVGSIAVKCNLSAKERKAVQIAQEYLAQKYEQEMIYESVRYSWIDPGLYHVYFISSDTDVHFEVQMWPKVLDFPEETTDDKYIWDNYLNSFFCQKTKETILPKVKMIWDEKVGMQVILSTGKAYPLRGTVEPNEQTTAIEMEPFYNYEFYINTNRILDNESKMEEATRILDMIQYVQDSQYQPREMLFWYQTGSIEKGKDVEKNIEFVDGSMPSHSGKLENWIGIYNVEDVIAVMDEQLFNE